MEFTFVGQGYWSSISLGTETDEIKLMEMPNRVQNFEVDPDRPLVRVRIPWLFIFFRTTDPVPRLIFHPFLLFQKRNPRITVRKESIPHDC